MKKEKHAVEVINHIDQVRSGYVRIGDLTKDNNHRTFLGSLARQGSFASPAQKMVLTLGDKTGAVYVPRDEAQALLDGYGKKSKLKKAAPKMPVPTEEARIFVESLFRIETLLERIVKELAPPPLYAPGEIIPHAPNS